MPKDYKKWFKLKPKINGVELPKTFHVNIGEVWWCSFGENIGIEIDGKGNEYLRPALVTVFFNKNHIWILPLTTNNVKNRFHIEVTSFSKSSFVITSQLRTVSTTRLSRFIGKISKEDFRLVTESLVSILKYETPELVGGISRPLGNNTLSLSDESNLSN